MSGYSKKTLEQKLGIKDGMRIGMPKAASDLDGSYDFLQFFTKEKSELENMLPHLKKSLDKKGMLWISWPKKAAKLPTDLNENLVRETGLKNGLVDVKVVAIDEVWSGLKFVYRIKDR